MRQPLQLVKRERMSERSIRQHVVAEFKRLRALLDESEVRILASLDKTPPEAA